MITCQFSGLSVNLSVHGYDWGRLGRMGWGSVSGYMYEF